MSKLSLPLWLKRSLKAGIALSMALVPSPLLASVYNGCGILCGIQGAASLSGTGGVDDISTIITKIITFILDLVLIVAVLMIIIAGVRLIISGGDEAQKDKAKKTILYVIVGIIVILLARFIVDLVYSFFTNGGLGVGDISALIIQIITFILDLVLIVAVVMIIIAGIRLIISQGDESQKDKAKKTILYVIIGIIVILFARIIVVVVSRLFG